MVAAPGSSACGTLSSCRQPSCGRLAIAGRFAWAAMGPRPLASSRPARRRLPCWSPPAGGRLGLKRRPPGTLALGAGDGPVSALVVALLILVALLLAPERPRDQEAICQRHNGVAACRVW
jgi:hypothetical protein